MKNEIDDAMREAIKDFPDAKYVGASLNANEDRYFATVEYCGKRINLDFWGLDLLQNRTHEMLTDICSFRIGRVLKVTQ